MRKSGGFTLIEVVVSVLILAFIATFTGGAIRNAVRSKVQMQRTFDNTTAVREALQVLQRDISLAYHEFDFQEKLLKEVNAELAKSKGGTNPEENAQFLQQAAAEQQEKPLTVFLGEQNKLEFTARSHTRTRAEAKESNFIRIKYYVENCKSPRDPTIQSPCLIREVFKNIYAQDFQSGEKQTLIDQVDTFELRYYSSLKEEPTDQFKSDSGLDDVQKNAFPDAVEIKLTIKDKVKDKEMPYSMVAMAPIRFSNNIEKEMASQPAAGTPEEGPGDEGSGTGDDGEGPSPDGNDGEGNNGGNNGGAGGAN